MQHDSWSHLFDIGDVNVKNSDANKRILGRMVLRES